MALKFRRGTTAQQSGSLAFGEPYVNTTLGTLLVGGASGDIQLANSGPNATFTGASVSASSFVSASSLKVTGNASVDGDLTLGGKLTIGDATSDTINVVASLSSSLIPQTTNAFDLGSADKIWRDLYVSTGSIKFVEGTTVVKTLNAATLTALEVATGSANASVTNLNSFTSSIDTTIKTKINTDGVVSGSSQITYASISSIPAGIVSGSAQVTPLLPTGTISGSSQLDGTNITNLTITNLTTVNQTASVVFSSGSNRFGDAGNDTHSFTGSVQISGSLTTIGASTATSFNGAINANNGVVSGSSQISHDSTTGYVANKHIDHTSVLISAGNGLSGGGDISSTRTLSLDATSVTFTDGVKSKLNTDGVISGSSQIDATATTNWATGIKTQLNVNTVVSGSSQIDVSSTTGDIALGSRTSGNYVASLVAGTNITLSNNSGEGATPTIGLTNNTISGISLGSNLATLTIGTGLSGTSYNGSTGVTIANTGVTSNVAGTGIGVSGATGAVTITNTGVTAITAGTGVSRDTSTGNVTISIGQSVATNATPTFGNLTINGTITATGDITAYYTSDIRHKNNVELIDNALEKVNALNGVTWEWNDDVDEVTKQTPTTGLIAQDVLDVLPEVVKTRENGFLALDYSKMVGLLVEAIKEQDIVIQKLKTDMLQLNNTITVFEDRMKEKGLL